MNKIYVLPIVIAAATGILLIGLYQPVAACSELKKDMEEISDSMNMITERVESGNLSDAQLVGDLEMAVVLGDKFAEKQAEWDANCK